MSLTTISLLWNVADLVGRAAPGSEGGAPGGGTEEEAVSPGAGLRLTQEEGDVILELIFSALQASLVEMGRDVLVGAGGSVQGGSQGSSTPLHMDTSPLALPLIPPGPGL